MGRPRKEIDQKQFESLCALQCTKVEICAFFEITDKTLDAWCRRTYRKRFSEVFQEKRCKGKISLRRNQWRLAEKSTAMAIFLGKQYLEQTETLTVEEPQETDNPLIEAINKNASRMEWNEEEKE